MPDSRVYRLICGLVFVLAFMVAYAAPSIADEAGVGPKRTIKGKPGNRRAVEALLEESEGDAEVKIRGGKVKELKGKFKIDKNKPVEDAALDFIDRHRNAYGLKDPKSELKKDSRDGLGFQQLYNGVPIWQKSMRVHFNENHDISLIQSNLVPTPDIDTTPLITAEEAIGLAKADLKIPADARVWPAKAELMVYNSILAYKVDIDDWLYFIDAKDGNIISKDSMIIP